MKLSDFSSSVCRLISLRFPDGFVRSALLGAFEALGMHGEFFTSSTTDAVLLMGAASELDKKPPSLSDFLDGLWGEIRGDLPPFGRLVLRVAFRQLRRLAQSTDSTIDDTILRILRDALAGNDESEPAEPVAA